MKAQTKFLNNDSPLALLPQKADPNLRDLVDKLEDEVNAAQCFMQLLIDSKRPGATEVELTEKGVDYLLCFWIKIQMDLIRTFEVLQQHVDAELGVQRQSSLPVATN